MLHSPESRSRTRTATGWGIAAGAAVFFLVLFDFGTNVERTAVAIGYGSNFYDLQAQAFLHGHLYLPDGSLGIEGFVVGGHTYMYFPPFPALLRIPLMLVTHEFDGRLSLVSMGVAWIVFAIMATKLFWLVRECARPDAPLGRAEAVVCAFVLATITGGTTLVFDASLPWVYHEAYLWAVALAAGALYWLVRVGIDPTAKAIWWLGGFNLALIMTRATGGFALCAVSLVVAVRALTGRPHPDRRRAGWAIGAAALVPLATSVAYNVIKFHHPYLFPLQDQVWTAVNPRRREALHHNGGTITGPQFLLTGIVNYLRPDGIRFTSWFPWITLPAHPAPAYGGAFLDQSYRTGSAPAFMPLLTLLTVWSLVRTYFVRSGAVAKRALRLPLLGALLIPFGVLDYGYLAHRYTSEFVPLLVLGAAIGCADLAPRLGALRLRWLVPSMVIIAALALSGIAANAATGFTAAAQTYGGDPLRRYVSLQEETSGFGGLPPVVQSTTLPTRAPTDELRIVGNCNGLYLSTGDAYQPWVTVENRPVRLRVIIRAKSLRRGQLLILTISGLTPTTVYLQVDPRGRLRFVTVTGARSQFGSWLTVTRGEEYSLIVTTRTDFQLFQVSALPGGPVAAVSAAQFDDHGDTHLGFVRANVPGAAAQRRVGVQVEPGVTAPPDLCARIAHDAGINVGG